MYNEIKQSLSITQVLEYYGIKLDYHNKALCPIHNEKVKSFKVYPNRNRFKCFSCLAAGSIIDFVIQYFKINNFEACKKLDEDFNLNLFKTNLTNEEKKKMELNRKQIEDHLNKQKEIKQKKELKLIRINEIFAHYDILCERFKPKFPELPSCLFIFLNSKKEFYWEQLLKLEQKEGDILGAKERVMIKEFTRADFDDRQEPYEFCYKFKDNEFQHAQVISKLSEQASKLGLNNFKTMYKSFVKEKK